MDSFGQSQIVTPVAALSTAHIVVTTPCLQDTLDSDVAYAPRDGIGLTVTGLCHEMLYG